MSTIHITVGEANAKPIEASISQDSENKDEVFILKDYLNIGPLKTTDMTYNEGRNAVWEKLKANQKSSAIDDLERLMQLSTRISNGENIEIWFWMAANAEDICAYFWLLHFLKKHQGKFSIINIAGLPFLDNEAQLFYPKTISELPLRQVFKARKLKRLISVSEWEAEEEEWKKMVLENAEIRSLGNGKNLLGKTYDFYDQSLLAALSENQKSNKLVQSFAQKYNFSHTASLFLQWRIQEIKNDVEPITPN